jgi:arabinose-5-phosphate isomerase
MFINNQEILNIAQDSISVEIESLQRMKKSLDERFCKAIAMIQASAGRLIVSGMGKSGIIGKKISATLSSTGTASYFVHPGEAFHGDLGMIKEDDIVLMISYSGETEELVRLIPFLKHQKNTIIAFTGNHQSTLSKHADVSLDISVEREACSINLAPTSSTTAMLVMGDALAVTLAKLNNFQPEDFAKFHPGGNIGKILLTTVADVMVKQNLPKVLRGAHFREILETISSANLGLTAVIDSDAVLGIITDGDIRRTIEKSESPQSLCAGEIMSSSPKMIAPDTRVTEAEKLMIQYHINALLVTNEKKQLLGVLRRNDCTLAKN